MPHQHLYNVSPPPFCTPMFNTIKELAKLDSKDARHKLLQQMQTALDLKDLPMNDDEIRQTIEYLNNLMQSDLSKLLNKKQFSGVLLDKKLSHLNVTMAIVFDPETQLFDLMFLIGSKFYNLPDDIILGVGGSKIVKKVLRLRFTSNEFIVDIRACAKEKIARFSIRAKYPESNINIDVVNKNIVEAETIDEILKILYELETKIYKNNGSLTRKFIHTMRQIEIFKKLDGISNLSSLAFIRPYIKPKRTDRYHFKMHFFDKVAKFGNLNQLTPELIMELNLPVLGKELHPEVNSNFETLINVLAFAIQQMHQRGVIHYDLKTLNILLDDKWLPRIIDYGCSIDVAETRENTKKLLLMLGYSNPGDGYIDGNLLDPSALNTAIKSLLILGGNNKIVPYNHRVTPTLAYLNVHLNKISEYILVDKFKLISAFYMASPEVFVSSEKIYYSDANIINCECLGKKIVYMLSETARKEISKNVDFKHDSWAFGVTILNILTAKDLRDLAFEIAMIENNVVLAALLHPDIEYRATIAEFNELRKKHPIIQAVNPNNVESLVCSYEQKIIALNFKLESIVGWRQKINLLVEELRLMDLTNQNYLDKFPEKIDTYIMACKAFSSVKRSQLLLPLIFEMINKFSMLNQPWLRSELGRQIDGLIVLVLNDLNLSALEKLLHKSMVSGVDFKSIDLLIDRLKNIPDWRNYSLWHYNVSIWDACLSDSEITLYFKRLYLSIYIQRLGLEPRAAFKEIINTDTKNISDCIAVLIMDGFLTHSFVIDYDVFKFIAEEPDCCMMVNEKIAGIMSKVEIMRGMIEGDLLEVFGIRSSDQILNSCLNSLSYANRYNNQHYIILLLREFGPYWHENEVAQQQMAYVSLNCVKNNVDIAPLRNYLTRLPINERHIFHDSLLREINLIAPESPNVNRLCCAI